MPEHTTEVESIEPDSASSHDLKPQGSASQVGLEHLRRAANWAWREIIVGSVFAGAAAGAAAAGVQALLS